MEFPITRERLQKYRKDEFLRVETEQRVKEVAQIICKGVENAVLNTNDTKYVFNIRIPVIQGILRHSGSLHTHRQQENILTSIMEKLNELFPDCTIQVDPLQTYILIDWS